MSIPTHSPDGNLYIRFIDFTEQGVVLLGYPKHPEGRYISLADLERVAEEDPETLLASLLPSLNTYPAAPPVFP